MSSLFSALDIARSGLQVSQVQLDTAAHNIANVNKEGYSRQRVDLVSPSPATESYGSVGRGVQVQLIERIRESFLDTVYRDEVSDMGASEVRAAYFERVEDLLSEPDDTGFGTNISDFFDTLNDFANNVEEQSVRMSAITQAESLASSFNGLSQEIYSLQTNANEEVTNAVPEINSIAQQIADLNVAIRNSEAGGNTANDLRDERDVLLDELAGKVNITYREEDNGQVDVLIGGDSFITGDSYRELAAVRDSSLSTTRSDLVTVQFADNGSAVDIQSGLLYGAIQVRDSDLASLSERVDTMAAAIIHEVNLIQSSGNGLDNLSGTISAANAVTDSSAALNSAGLPFDVSAGSFDVIVYDADGNPTTTTINITDSTTLDSLAADLNSTGNFSASVTDGVLSLGASSGYTYSFANDSAGVLASLGVNCLFTGSDASTMGVSDAIVDNPSLLTSGYSTDVDSTGDNTAALAMANLRTANVLDGDTVTISEYYETTVVRVGTDSSAVQQECDVQQSFVDDFEARRQEVSGVSTDEEVTNLMLFQRAYEASARVITVTNTMLDALFDIV